MIKKIIPGILMLAMIPVLCMTLYAKPVEEIPVLAEQDADVLAVFAAQKKQPRPLLSSENTNLDTIWIFLTDGRFMQYAFMDDAVQLYSCGTYEYEEDFENMQIHRTQKHMEGAGFLSYSSIHPYVFNASEYTALVTPYDAGRVAAAYAGIGQQPYTDAGGEEQMLDTWWICYSDGTFAQYAALHNRIIPFSTGTCRLPEGLGPDLQDEGGAAAVTITQTARTQGSAILAPYSPEQDYNLAEMDLTMLILDME